MACGRKLFTVSKVVSFYLSFPPSPVLPLNCPSPGSPGKAGASWVPNPAGSHYPFSEELPRVVASGRKRRMTAALRITAMQVGRARPYEDRRPRQQLLWCCLVWKPVVPLSYRTASSASAGQLLSSKPYHEQVSEKSEEHINVILAHALSLGDHR